MAFERERESFVFAPQLGIFSLIFYFFDGASRPVPRDLFFLITISTVFVLFVQKREGRRAVTSGSFKKMEKQFKTRVGNKNPNYSK